MGNYADASTLPRPVGATPQAARRESYPPQKACPLNKLTPRTSLYQSGTTLLPLNSHLSTLTFAYLSSTPYSLALTRLQIIFENDQFLVSDKPPCLMIHPSKPGGPRTVLDELKQILAFELLNGGKISLINRLDRETSGLVLVGKKTETAHRLHRLMERSEIRKTYTAIVTGWPQAELFTVSQPLLRQGRVRPSRIWLKQAVHPDGYPSTTEFKVLQQFTRKEGAFSVIQAEPKTGRTHQIRVHLSFAGHPIVGDKIYGPDETCYLEFINSGWTKALECKLLLPRQALHATRLAFTLEHENFELTAQLPPDMANFVKA
ncbi:MAG: RNA pseudouridine synthase [Chthoniobacterales bacterium]